MLIQASAMATSKDLTILQGKTFALIVRWETEPIVRKAISGISLTAGAPRLTVLGHGCPDGWRAAVTLVKGMTPLNAQKAPPGDSDYFTCTVLDSDHIEFNEVTPVDESGREWPAWVAGGFLQWNTPASLLGVTARMKIKDKPGGALLASSDPADAPKDILVLTVDDSTKTISLTIAATDTAAVSWTRGVYDLEVVDSSGKVTLLCAGKITVSKEVTT